MWVRLPAGSGEGSHALVPPDRVVSRRMAHTAVHQAERDVRGRSGVASLGVGQAGRGRGQPKRSGGKQCGSQARGAEKA
jgi:hypothetical protein